jgi:hypothetical protein
MASTIRLGKMPVKQVEAVKVRVEALNAAAIAGIAIDSDTAAWLAKVGSDLHDKLSGVGLVQPRNRQNMAAFLDTWLARREGNKPNSVKNYKAAIGKLKEYFGEEIGLHEITHGKALDFMADLLANHAKTTAATALEIRSPVLHRSCP